MALNHEPVSQPGPGRDIFTRQSITSTTVIGTVVLSVLTLIATYLFGGFDGLSGSGAGALIFGVIASFALGVGLMVVVFHSSRQYDDAAHYAAMDHFTKEQRGSDASEGASPPTPSAK